MTAFTPLQSLLGGALIGLSAAILMLFNGRIAGIMGIFNRWLNFKDEYLSLGPLLFILGLVLSPLLAGAFGFTPQIQITQNKTMLIVAGLLVGFGTTLGSGCTSGHGVCGLSRFSIRSLVATCIFMITAALTVYLMRHGAK